MMKFAIVIVALVATTVVLAEEATSKPSNGNPNDGKDDARANKEVGGTPQVATDEQKHLEPQKSSGDQNDRDFFVNLSKFTAESKSFPTQQRCNWLEQKFRQLGGPVGETMERGSLFEYTIGYLRARSLPFDNNQPALELLIKCQKEHPEQPGGATDEHSAANDARIREVIASPMVRASAPLISTPMKDVHEEFNRVKLNQKDFGQDLYGPREGARKFGAEESFRLKLGEDDDDDDDDDDSQILLDTDSDARSDTSSHPEREYRKRGAPMVSPIGLNKARRLELGYQNPFGASTGEERASGFDVPSHDKRPVKDMNPNSKRARKYVHEAHGSVPSSWGPQHFLHRDDSIVNRVKFDDNRRNSFDEDRSSTSSNEVFDKSKPFPAMHEYIDGQLEEAMVEREPNPLRKLSDRLKELESQVEAIQAYIPKNQNEREKFKMMRDLYNYSIYKQLELSEQLEEAHERIIELEAARRDELIDKRFGKSIDKSDDDYDLKSASQKLYNKMSAREPLESRCQKYYILYNQAGRKTKDFVKTVARLELPPVSYVPSDNFAKVLQVMQTQLSNSGDKHLLDDLNDCLQSIRNSQQTRFEEVGPQSSFFQQSDDHTVPIVPITSGPLRTQQVPVHLIGDQRKQHNLSPMDANRRWDYPPAAQIVATSAAVAGGSAASSASSTDTHSSKN